MQSYTRTDSHAQGIGQALTAVQPPAVKSVRSKKDLEKVRVLFLCDYNVNSAPAVCDAINAFYKYSEHQITILSKLGTLPKQLKINDFDVVVIHYSLTLAIETYVSSETRRQLSEFKGLKIVFIQDEYRFIDRTIDAMREIGVDVVFTVMKPSELSKVYPEGALPNTRFEHILTGYVPQWLTYYRALPYAKRKFDVGYRGRSYPAWHGSPGRDRVKIGARFLKDARRYGLKVNIRWDEKSRIYGAAWVEFLRQSRAQLCTESSIGVFDRDGTISSRVETYVDMLKKTKEEPELKDEEYNEVKEKFFAGEEGKVDTSLVSPRAFEAVAIRTLLVMYEGRYSDIFVPWRHYVPLKKDHSNMDEVVQTIKDPKKAAEIVANAFAEIAQNPKYSYNTLVTRFDEVIREMITPERQSKNFYFDRERYSRLFPFPYHDNPYSIGADRLTIVGELKYQMRRIVSGPVKRIRAFFQGTRIRIDE